MQAIEDGIDPATLGIGNSRLHATPNAHSRPTQVPAVSANEPNLFKELVDKLAWALGKTYGERYSRRTPARDWAVKVACQVSAYMRHHASLDGIDETVR